MKFIKRLFSISNLVIIATIILGVIASVGIIDKYLPSEKMLIALVTLMATQLLVDRLGILTAIYEKVGNRTQDYFIELLPRTNPDFERFSAYVQGASEIMVIGIDLGFMATADAWYVKQILEKGVDLKLLVSDPDTTGDLKRVIDNHDERNSLDHKPVHDHMITAKETLETLRTLVTPSTKGKLEIRARVDIPNPTLTLVDPTQRHGKMRVELKLYKRVHGEVPYFLLTQSSVWYDMFLNHYYVKLWNDSKVLFTTYV